MFTNHKIITLALFFALLLFLTGCQEILDSDKGLSTNEQNNESNSNSNTQTVEPAESDISNTKVGENQIESVVKEQVEKNVEDFSLIDETFLPNLSKGIIKYCELPLDSNITASDILSKFGEPEWEDYWDGGYGRLYGDCLYFVDSENSDAIMTAIDYGSEKLTHTPSEIIERLGEPESKGISEIDGSYFLFYKSGEYSAYFEFEDENSPVWLLRIK